LPKIGLQKKMEQARLAAQTREGRGKGVARSTRRAGMIPAIVYGHKIDPMAIQMPEKELHHYLTSGSESVIINMSVGDEEQTVMVKEVQIDPVSRMIVHADFVRVSLEEVVTTHVPFVIIGKPAGIEEGGIMEFLLRELQIQCQVGKLPENIELDVSALGIHDQIRIGDLELGEDMSIMDDPSTIIVAIAAPTIIEEPEVEEELGEEGEETEPEVIGEKRDDDEEEEAEE